LINRDGLNTLDSSRISKSESIKMSQALITSLLWFGAIGCGLLAGVYFAFSAFIMTALRRIEPSQAIASMNSINSTILGSLFMPFFYGTTLASLILAFVGLARPGPGAIAMLAGGMIYVGGMFLCTILFNVPLNNALGTINAASEEAARVWARYLNDWTFWNHLRTIASTAAGALYVAAIAAR
jgi:uncharacterized membrane protein